MPNHQLDRLLPTVLITMGGRGVRFKEAGYKEPKPFVNVLNKPMIFRVMDLFPQKWSFVCVLNNEDYDNQHIRRLKDYVGESRFQHTTISPNSNGPLQTVMAGVELIADEQPVFVTYCDYGQEWDAQDFLKFVETHESDICFISYKGFHPHYLGPNMYCYTKTDGIKVLDIKEKECFSDRREKDYASTGGYYFRNAKLLKKALLEQQKQHLSWNGEYFTSLAVKALMNVETDLKVHVYEINKFFQWGTPEDLQAFEYWAKVKYENFFK